MEDLSLIRFNYNETSKSEELFNGEILLVSDTENHCIRLIDLKIKRVTTIAGFCGESGFKDGYPSTSRLNLPKNLGIDRKNRIYIYDSGNNYVRILETPEEYTDPESFVLQSTLKTMVHGSCFNIESYGDNNMNQVDLSKFKYSFCYSDWLKTEEGD